MGGHSSAMTHALDSLVIAGLDPRLSGTVFASQGELELGQRRQGEISLPPLDSADKGWYLDAMKEGVSDRCEEVRRGFLRFGSIVQQLEQQIGNDGGSNLKPDGVGRAAMKVADFQVLFDPAEKQFDLPAGLVEIGNGLCRTIEIVGEQLERLAGIDGDGDHPAVLGEGIPPAAGQPLGQSNDLIADDGGAGWHRPLRRT